MRKLPAYLTLLLMSASLPGLAQGQLSVFIDGQPVNFDQPPVMMDGRVLVPLRGIFEHLGADVHYDAATRHIEARKGPLVVELTLGSQNAVVSGRAVTLDTPANTIGGRTVVPLRFVSESLGADVRWEAAARTIQITSAHAPPPVAAPPPPPPPVSLSPLPPDDSTVTQTRPKIGATFSEPIRFESVRLRVDDKELPLHVLEHNPTTVQWIPPYDLPDGPHRASVEAITVNNREVRRGWKFDVVSGHGLIQEVDFHPSGPFTGGQTLEIVVRGVPHGRCFVDFGGRTGIPMNEVSPGVYRTGYTVANNDHGEFPVVAHMSLSDGRNDTERSHRPLVLNVGASAVAPGLRIMAPVNGQRVGSGFIVRGQAFPNAHIEVRVSSEDAVVPGVVSVRGAGDEARGQANPAGYFEVNVPVGNTPPGAALKVHIRAFDDQNHGPPPTEVHVSRQ